MELNNLTSFAYWGNRAVINAENFRAFFLNNQSLETLSLKGTRFEGSSDGPPVILSNLKSLTVDDPDRTLPTIFHVPALQRLSSLSIYPQKGFDFYWATFRATGDGITFIVEDLFDEILGIWKNLTGYARPTIEHVRLDNPDKVAVDIDGADGMITLLMDAHTLEIGLGYVPDFYPDFWDDLKELGPQLKTIRFEISEEPEAHDYEHEAWCRALPENIQELVTHRFEQGRPFSAIERMVVSESERVNQQQDFVWRMFYNDYFLDEYVRRE